ncbi:thioesterase [Microbispora sp. RL4-1S]|uniref:Thioesterase n=1 Tax=Microbispora oryzae TaxID=2806554 RepID=A0A940WT34_9ACTN|nr:alpha/beta fold hydrolase [Microbispora oryzae]MBP2706920.1 thioesterase [Microbispora oryzae]
MTNPADDNLWIRRFHHEPNSRVTLVCFPHAGGSASFFYPVSDAMQSTLQVVALQYPGRQDRRHERPLTTIDELADESFAALRPLMDRPLAFFGHSMGATVAYEVAVRMKRELAADPVTLFASGRRAPSRHRDETVHRRDDDGVVAELKSLSGTDSSILGDLELLRMILPAIRSDYTAIETYRYRPGPLLDCPIVALVGTSDPKVTLDEAGSWADHTTGGFEMRTFEGGHFYLARHQRAVINLISDQLLSLTL